MKNARQRVMRTILAGLLPLALASCVSEELQNNVQKGDANVTFSLMLPGSSTPSRGATRALTDVQENYVQAIDVLMFEYDNGSGDGKFVDVARASGTAISTDNTDGTSSRSKTFSVTMKQGRYDLVILANARDFIDRAALAGTYKKAALASLETKAAWQGKWPADNSRPIPMWGGKDDVTVSETTDLTGSNALSMTRMVARVDVVVNTAQVTNFQLTSVRVYNYNTRGSFVPYNYWDASCWNPAHVDGARVVVPSVPAGSTLTEGPLVYTLSAGDRAANKYTQEIYLYESENHTGAPHTNANKKGLLQRTCLVVGGVYGSDGAETFYRVDFSTGSGVSQSYQDVLRNFWYTFRIDKVSDSGFADPDVAYRSEPVNIEANVLEWNDAGVGDITFDGQNYLSIRPSNELSFCKETETQQIGIKTDAAAGWRVSKITEADGTTVNDGWLTTIETMGAAGDYRTLTVNVTANGGAAARTGYILIAAGRLEARVKVTQSNESQKNQVFRFIEFTNVAGSGTTVPAAGGAIKAKVNTNMGWSFRADNAAITAYTFAEPSSEVAADVEGSIAIPANESWSAKSTKVWADYAGTNMAEQTYTQAAGYNIACTAPATIALAGGSTSFTFSGYWPANTQVRATIGGNQVGSTVPLIATGSITVPDTRSASITISANETGVDRNVVLEYYNESDWVAVTNGTITQKKPFGGYADVLYFKGDGTLAVGRWGDGNVTQANLAYFKFGSVVGFTNNNEAWAAGRVQFNPVTSAPSYATYTDIPCYATADWDANRKNISDNAYHNITNVKAGKGDPARLVGMTAAQIQACTTDADLYALEASLKTAGNGGWRTATKDENCVFVSGTTSINAYSCTVRAYYPDPSTSVGTNFIGAPNSGRAYFPVCADGTFVDNGYSPLFAAGYRFANGTTTSVGSLGQYWSSTADSGSSGYRLYFYYSYVYLATSSPYATGFGVRVIRPE